MQTTIGIANYMNNPKHPVFYSEMCCLGSAYTVAVTTIMCIYAAVKICYPALIAWREDPDLSSFYVDLQLPALPVPSLVEQINSPIREPTPEEVENAKQQRVIQLNHEYAKALTRVTREALQKLVFALCIQMVAWPFFVIHWRFLHGVTATEGEAHGS
jgi:hypothetical protein